VNQPGEWGPFGLKPCAGREAGDEVDGRGRDGIAEGGVTEDEEHGEGHNELEGDVAESRHRGRRWVGKWSPVSEI